MRKYVVEFEAVERSFRENTGIGWGITLSRWESVQLDKKRLSIFKPVVLNVGSTAAHHTWI